MWSQIHDNYDCQCRVAMNSDGISRRGGKSGGSIEPDCWPPHQATLSRKSTGMANAAGTNAFRRRNVASMSTLIRPDVNRITIVERDGICFQPQLQRLCQV